MTCPHMSWMGFVLPEEITKSQLFQNVCLSLFNENPYSNTGLDVMGALGRHPQFCELFDKKLFCIMRYPTLARKNEIEGKSWDHWQEWPTALGSFLTLPLSGCVTISKLPLFSVPQLLHLVNGGNQCKYLIRLIWRLSEIIQAEHLAQRLTQSKH